MWPNEGVHRIVATCEGLVGIIRIYEDFMEMISLLRMHSARAMLKNDRYVNRIRIVALATPCMDSPLRQVSATQLRARIYTSESQRRPLQDVAKHPNPRYHSGDSSWDLQPAVFQYVDPQRARKTYCKLSQTSQAHSRDHGTPQACAESAWDSTQNPKSFLAFGRRY